MTDILNNPDVQKAINQREIIDKVGAIYASRIMPDKAWDDMSELERETCVRFIVSEVSSEDELRQRLVDQLGLDEDSIEINWSPSEESNEADQELRKLIKALGGIVTERGDLVSVIIDDESF